jgi:uncharacterized protein
MYMSPTQHLAVQRQSASSNHAAANRNACPRHPENVSKAYTPDSIWRNRNLFLRGSPEIFEFLTAKWKKEKNYRLRKELFSWTENKIAVQFWYEYQDSHDGMKWKR